MGRVLVLAVVLFLTPVALGSSGALYSDPAGDYTKPPQRIVHPDIRSVVVSSTTKTVTFEVRFARSLRELDSIEVAFDLDPRQGNQGWLSLGRQRTATRADAGVRVMFVWTAIQDRSPLKVYGWRWTLTKNGVTDGAVRKGTMRVDRNVARLTLSRTFTVTESGARPLTVRLPETFSFVVWAWGDQDMKPDIHDPDEDWAPNAGWFRYPPR